MLGPTPHDVYAAAFAASIEPMLILTSEGRIRELNSAAASLLGMLIGEARGALASEALRPSPDLAALLTEAVAAPRASALPEEATIRFGAERPVAVAGSASPVAVGEAPCVLLVLRDVTDERRAASAIKEREERSREAIRTTELALERERMFARLLLDTNPNMVFVKDSKARFRLANKAYFDMFETASERVIGKTTHEILPSRNEAARLDAVDQEVLATGRMHNLTHPIFRPSGERRWVITTKLPLALGEERFVIGNCVDITERKEYEDMLQETIAELERQKHDIASQLEIIQRQQDLIQALSTPILQVAEGVLAVPLIGALDDARAANVTEKLLEEVTRTRARFALIDVTAVELMDAAMAGRFVRMISAIRLLGASGIVTGIQPAVARSLCDLGVDLGGVETKQNLRAALEACMRVLGSSRAAR